MKCITMSYKGFEFPVNVKSINASFSKRISNIPIPKKSAKSQEICFNPAVIKGDSANLTNFSLNLARAQTKRRSFLLRLFAARARLIFFHRFFLP